MITCDSDVLQLGYCSDDHTASDRGISKTSTGKGNHPVPCRVNCNPGNAHSTLAKTKADALLKTGCWERNSIAYFYKF